MAGAGKGRSPPSPPSGGDRSLYEVGDLHIEGVGYGHEVGVLDALAGLDALDG